MWLTKTLLTLVGTNQRGAGQFYNYYIQTHHEASISNFKEVVKGGVQENDSIQPRLGAL
jgi:hypothetical protein